jgi:hypothetical protein
MPYVRVRPMDTTDAGSGVFISYSHDSEAHAERVLALADGLRTGGVEVEIDQYVAHPEEGWPQWARRRIVESAFVLLVCTPAFRRHFERKVAPGEGERATWEALIAEQIVFDAGGINRKIIPVLFEEGSREDIPRSLRAYTSYQLPKGYDDLYRRLTGQPKVVPPPVGKIRPMPPINRPGVATSISGISIGPRAEEPTKAELDGYLAKIDTLHGELHLAGFETKVRVPIELDDLYVPLDAVVDRSAKRRQVFGSSELAQGQDAEIALARAFEVAAEHRMRGVVLLGDPGSGKTTHLEQVLLQVARKGAASIGLPEGTVPVFLPLRRLRDLDAGLPGFIQQELTDPLLDVPKDFGERLAAHARDRPTVDDRIGVGVEGLRSQRDPVPSRAGTVDDARDRLRVPQVGMERHRREHGSVLGRGGAGGPFARKQRVCDSAPCDGGGMARVRCEGDTAALGVPDPEVVGRVDPVPPGRVRTTRLGSRRRARVGRNIACVGVLAARASGVGTGITRGEGAVGRASFGVFRPETVGTSTAPPRLRRSITWMCSPFNPKQNSRLKPQSKPSQSPRACATAM